MKNIILNFSGQISLKLIGFDKKNSKKSGMDLWSNQSPMTQNHPKLKIFGPTKITIKISIRRKRFWSKK
jgi:hypothetical protein